MSALKTLMPETSKVIQKLAKLEFLKDFTFVGGSALTVHLSHRYSEDIDLFTWHQELNSLNIQHQIEKAGFKDVKTINLSPTQADFIVDNVKLTFFANDWDELKNRQPLTDNLFIADLKTIAVMKVNTLFMRAMFRDYYDLYVLSLQYFSIRELYDMTAAKMNNLSKTLFQRALIFTKDIEDEDIEHLNPKYHVTLQQIEDHFNRLIKKWNNS